MKIWITKWALTQGIIEAEATDEGDGYAKVKGDYSLYRRDEWYRSKEDAIKHSEVLRDKKIKSLEKQILKIKNLKF